jgi:hypothetical protein
MGYYIYLHIRLDNGMPFYVGKGKDRRSSVKRQRSAHWQNTVLKYGYDILIVQSGLSEKDAFDLEKYWIKRLGRKDKKQGLLVNFSDGGEGSSGRPMNDKTKNIIIELNKKRINSQIQRHKVGSLFKGKFGKEHNRSKAVVCVETGIEYGSQLEAQRELKLSNGSVSWSIKNKKPIFGMHFEIKE